MVALLAAMGEGQHAHSALKRMLEEQGVLRCQTEIAPSEHVAAMLLPSTWVHTLHRFYPRAFRSVLGADVEKLRHVWTTCFFFVL